MPYKRPDSPYYYCRRKALVGYGDSGRLSSGVTSKRVAERMERVLEELAERALVEPTWTKLLDAVCKEKTLSLPDLLRARNERRLDGLLAGLHDPDLREAIAAYLASTNKGRMVRLGFDMLRALAPKGARLSYVRDPKNVLAMCRRVETKGWTNGDHKGDPIKRNSVRRTLYRAISLLLREELGQAERNRIMGDVHFPAEDDTREVLLEPAEIGRLLQTCDEVADGTGNSGYRELRVAIRLMLQTSADRGVVFAGTTAAGDARGLLVRDVRVYEEEEGGLSGEVYLPDPKTKDRRRTVPMTDGLCRELLALAEGKDADDPIFSVSYSQVDAMWYRVRGKAKLKHVRIKDLRSVAAIYGERAGVPLTVMARTLGHADESMTRRYQAHQAVMSSDQAGAIEAAMGLQAA